MIRYFFLLRKTESGRQNQNSLPFLFMGKILSLLKRIKISKGEIKWKENTLSTGFNSVLYTLVTATLSVEYVRMLAVLPSK